MKIRNFIVFVVGVALFQLSFPVAAHETEGDTVNVIARPSSYLVPASLMFTILATITGQDKNIHSQISANFGTGLIGESNFLQENGIPTSGANNFFSVEIGREAEGYDLVLFKRNAVEYLQDIVDADGDNGSSLKAVLYNGSYLAKHWCFVYLGSGLGIGMLDLRSQTDGHDNLSETGLVAQFRVGLNFPLTKKSLANLGYRNIIFIGNADNVVFHRFEGGLSYAW